MGRSVHVWCFGHYGHPVVVFPSAAGFEWQAQGMVEALEPMIQAGRISSIVRSQCRRSWTRWKATQPGGLTSPGYGDYPRYLVPFVREDCHQPNGRMAVAGALGALRSEFRSQYPSIFHYALHEWTLRSAPFHEWL